MSPSVSVIMPCFNAASFISQAIESVLNQSFQDWELLICNDSSTDESVAIIKQYADLEHRISLFHNPQRLGIAGARNTCLKNAKGRYVALLDADDIWYKEKLGKQIRFMQENEIALCYSYYHVCDEQGKLKNIVKAPGSVTLKKMMFDDFIGCPTAIYDSHKVRHVAVPDIWRCEAFAWWLIMLKNGYVKEAFCFREVTAQYRANPKGMSSERWEMVKSHFLCLHRYGGASKVSSSALVFCALCLKSVKILFPSIYNYFVRYF